MSANRERESPPLQPSSGRSTFHRVLRHVALGAALLYLVWNIVFLSRGRIPPSILTGPTGIPSPTTGGTRAIRFLSQGDIEQSLQAHPLAVPIVLLYVGSLLALIVNFYRQRRIYLAKGWLIAWLILLGISWIAKLLGPTEFW